MPVKIVVAGLSKRDVNSMIVYGITPLGRKGPVSINILSGSGYKTLLFSEVLIDLRSVPIDSVSGIEVQYGVQNALIGKSEITRWYENSKPNSLLPLSAYCGDHGDNLSKLQSLRHLDRGEYFKSVRLYIKYIWSSIKEGIQGIKSGIVWTWGHIFLSVSFLLGTFAFLLFCVLFMFKRNSIREPRLSTRPTGFLRVVLSICFIFSLILLISGIKYYKIQLVGGIDGGWILLRYACQFARYCLSLSVVFLLVTVGFPSFCILLILRKKPIREHRIPVAQTDLARWIFFMCLFAFLILQVFSIYNYKLRFLGFDAEYDLIYYSSIDIYHAARADHGMFQFMCILNKFILMPCFMFHMPLDTVSRMYCLNDACFYLFIAFAILFFTRRYDLAAVVVAAPVVLATYGIYYFISEDLDRSGCLMILYIAVYKGLKDGSVRNLILFPCLFFMLWSHLIMILLLVIFLGGLYKSFSQLIKDKWLLMLILGSICIRGLLVSVYDQARLNQMGGSIDLHTLGMFLLEYCSLYWYIFVLAVAVVYLSRRYQMGISEYKGLLIILPAILYFGADTRLHIFTDWMEFSKFTYPVNLFILMHGMVLITQYGSKYKKLILAGTCTMLLFCLSILALFGHEFMKRARLVETLNNMCISQDPNQSKWYINDDQLSKIEGIGHSANYFASIPFSTYQNLPITIQLMAGDQAEKKILDTVSVDRYCGIDKMSYLSVTLSIKDFNPYYFHFNKGPYKELVIDSAKLDVIRDIYK